MVGLYKITSPSLKVYIGQSWNIKRRWDDHRSEGRHLRQPKLGASFKKYGYSNHVFEIIVELPEDISQETMDLYEHIYIMQYVAGGIPMLNLTQGGGNFGQHSESSKNKLREANKGKAPWNKGKTGVYTKECNDKRRSSLQGHIMKPHVKAALAIANREAKPMLGKKHSEETKIKISKTKMGTPAWNKGISWSEEVKAKMYKFPKGGIPANAVLTIQQVKDIKCRLKNKEKGIRLAEEYNVTTANISNIKLGKIWGNILIG